MTRREQERLATFFAFSLSPFLITLALYLIVNVYPGHRLWGFDIFAYFTNWLPFYVVGCMFLVAVVGSYILSGYFKAGMSINSKDGNQYVVVGSMASIALLASFYFLRAQTHFLGDGYELLSLLATGNPLIEKSHQFAESQIHLWCYSVIGGSSLQDALKVYQAISIVAGCIYLFSTFWLTSKIFQQSLDRVLLFLALASGGWALLYFGYVENYSIFVLVVTVYCLSGILVARKQLGRWVIAIMQIVLISFHIFGVSLLPASIYLMLQDSIVSRWFSNLKLQHRLAIQVSTALIIMSALAYVWSSDLFFRVSLVPILSFQLVPEGYTLFSWSHLIDELNLMFLLLPGLLILVINYLRLPLSHLFSQPLYRWQGLAVLGSLGVAFIFDPKLGMPRDWDLFSFAGVPLGIMLYYGILANRSKLRFAAMSTLLAVLLAFSVLFSRAAGLAAPETGIAHFRDYLYLDKVKNRNGWYLLVNYYQQTGDSSQAESVRTEWKNNFPEEELIVEARRKFYQEKDLAATDSLVDLMLSINPAYPDAYQFKGTVYLQRQRFDSALAMYRLANALNPDRPNTLNDMGHAYFGLQKYDEAESMFLSAARLDSSGFAAQFNLARFYKYRNNLRMYYRYIVEAATHPKALPAMIEELIMVYLQSGQIEKARRIYCASKVVQRDTLFLPAIRKSLPAIDSILNCD